MLSLQTQFAIVCLLGAVMSISVVVPAVRNRDKPGATGLLIIAPGASLFSLAIVPLSGSLPDWRLYLTNSAIVAAGVLLAFGWVVTVGEHTEAITPGRRLFAVAGGYFATTQTLALTHPLHGLFFRFTPSSPNRCSHSRCN